MWKILEAGIVQWQVDDMSWNVEATGGDQGISIFARDRTEVLACLCPVGQDKLPTISENFIRGNSIHLIFTQGEGSYSLELVLTPVESSSSQLVLETKISIQTSLLDSHPTIDLEAKGDGLHCWTPPAESEWIQQSDALTVGASCITSVVSDPAAVSVLLGRRDYPVCLDLSDDESIRLRLFGDFLEKGVIRVARPWICIDRQTNKIDESNVNNLWTRLQAAPLPLTA